MTVWSLKEKHILFTILMIFPKSCIPRHWPHDALKTTTTYILIITLANKVNNLHPPIFHGKEGEDPDLHWEDYVDDNTIAPGYKIQINPPERCSTLASHQQKFLHNSENLEGKFKEAFSLNC